MIGIRSDEISSIDSEAGVIATLIHHPEFSFYSEFLLPNHFSDTGNRCVYAAITGLARQGITNIDPYNIVEYLNASEATRKIASDITVERLQELMEMSDVLARHTVDEYKLCVSGVMDSAMRRNTVRQLKKCEEFCYDKNIQNLEQKIYEAIDGVVSEFSNAEEIPSLGDISDDLWEDILAHQDGKEFGMPFKFPSLNEYTSIEPGELVVLGATAKGGKSMFMLNEAVDLLRRGKSVMYIDSELSDRLFLCRLISHLTKIEFSRVRSGRYTTAESAEIDRWRQWIKQQPLVHLYIPIFDQQTVYLSVKKTYHKFGKLDVLIVDYIKSTGDNTDAYATYAELGRFTDMIKNDIAGAMDIATLAAAQLTATGKLADSAKIARNASVIMLLLDKSPAEIERDGVECGNKRLVVALNRNGPNHVDGEWIDLRFNGNIISFEEAKQHVPISPY